MGPLTIENEKAWEDLYQCEQTTKLVGYLALTRQLPVGTSKIPMSEASKLLNKTVPIPEYPGYYAVKLDVFHQLHCLVLHPFPLIAFQVNMSLCTE
jgi:hypothetical protein